MITTIVLCVVGYALVASVSLAVCMRVIDDPWHTRHGDIMPPAVVAGAGCGLWPATIAFGILGAALYVFYRLGDWIVDGALWIYRRREARAANVRDKIPQAVARKSKTRDYPNMRLMIVLAFLLSATACGACVVEDKHLVFVAELSEPAPGSVTLVIDWLCDEPLDATVRMRGNVFETSCTDGQWFSTTVFGVPCGEVVEASVFVGGHLYDVEPIEACAP